MERGEYAIKKAHIIKLDAYLKKVEKTIKKEQDVTNNKCRGNS